MRKVVIRRAGSYAELRLEQVADPQPAAGEVLIEVEAIGVNYADCIVRMGLYASAREFVGFPITPGFEVAGRVAALGAGVTDLALDDRVFAVTLFNGYSSKLSLPRGQVFRVPESLSMQQAAALPAVFMTGYFAVFELVHPRRGSQALVHSAAGGVGGCLVQLCKVAGCEVTGVVGAAHKKRTALEAGCDYVIDKSTENLWRRAEEIAPRGFDAVYDANGVATLKQSYKHTRAAGKLVVYGFHSMLPRQGGKPAWLKLAADYLRTPRFSPLDMTNECRSVLAFNLSYLFERNDILQEGMQRILGWLGDGSVRAPPVQTFSLDQVADAHRAIESGSTIGKLVLLP